MEAIAGSVVTGMLGSALGGGGGGGGGGQQMASAPFSPQNVRTGMGSATFGGGTATGTLSPEYQAIRQQLLGQAGGIFGQPVSPEVQQLGQRALGASQGFLGQLDTYDPFQAAEKQFGRLEEILAPGREQQRQAQESRLFAQGRLGSTGGGLEQQAFNRAVEEQRSANLYNAFQQAQQTQQNLANMGIQLGGFGYQAPIQQQMLQQQLGMGALTGAQALDASTLDQLRIGAGMSPGATAIQSPTTFGQALGGSLLQQSAGLFGQGVQNWMNQTPQNYSGISGVNSGSQQDLMLAAQNF